MSKLIRVCARHLKREMISTHQLGGRFWLRVSFNRINLWQNSSLLSSRSLMITILTFLTREGALWEVLSFRIGMFSLLRLISSISLRCFSKVQCRGLCLMIFLSLIMMDSMLINFRINSTPISTLKHKLLPLLKDQDSSLLKA